MNQPTLDPCVLGPATGGRWMTVIFDDDVTPVDVVLRVLVAATGCDVHEASMEIWEAEAYGRAAVHFASETECRRAAEIISGAGIRVDVRPEWND